MRRTVPIYITVACVAAGAAFADDAPALRDVFADDFLIGAALDAGQIMGLDPASPEFLAKHFSALTAENAMKWERIHPDEDRYVFDYADRLTAFATSHGIHVAGHTLVWHKQTPGWVFRDASGRPASRELLLARMRSHIETVVGRYRGQVASWDVVNEALDADGELRDNRWRRIIGDDYVAKAFEFAHAADPDAFLNYNDFDLYLPAKRDGAIRLLDGLRRKGIPVHGIGMQAHYRLDAPANLQDVEDSIVAFSKAGFDVMITELDVSVLPNPTEAGGAVRVDGRFRHDRRFDPYTDGLPVSVERQLGQRYVDLFSIFLAHRDAVSRVTFWGVNDAQSWKNDWPMQGRTDYPLLFDRDNRPKPALFDIVALEHRVRDERDPPAVR
ncbi:MAG: endo-1,4-beta-xylanase [Woeseiaceae bacterium]